jgi:hypothetical protein
MQVFESPGQAVMYLPCPYKTILVLMNQPRDYFLQSLS